MISVTRSHLSLEAGEPDHVVESTTGHLSRRMLEHYSHIRLKAKKQALDRLDGSTKRDRDQAREVAPVAGSADLASSTAATNTWVIYDMPWV